MLHSNLTNVNQITLTNFRCAQSELWIPNLPWSNLSGEPLRTVILSCFKYRKVRSAPHRCDFKYNLFHFPTWKRPTPSCLQLPNNASHPADHVKSAQGPEALPRQSSAWLAGSMSQAWSRLLIKHYQETRHITWLCLIPPVRLTAARASHSSLPENSRSTHVQGKLPALPQDPHTTSDPALLTQREGRICGPSTGGALVYKHGQAEERKKAENGEKAHRLVGDRMSGWKTAEKPAPAPAPRSKSSSLMQGHSPAAPLVLHG